MKQAHITNIKVHHLDNIPYTIIWEDGASPFYSSWAGGAIHYTYEPEDLGKRVYRKEKGRLAAIALPPLPRHLNDIDHDIHVMYIKHGLEPFYKKNCDNSACGEWFARNEYGVQIPLAMMEA